MSDDDLTFAEAKSRIAAFCRARNWDGPHNPKDLAIGLVTEASELLELFRFVTPEQAAEAITDVDRRQAMADELADSLYFILRFAQLYKFDLSTCLREKAVKNARKYPALPSVPE